MSDAKAPVVETKLTIPKSLPWRFLIYSVTAGWNAVVFAYMMFYNTEYAGLSATSLVAFLSVARLVDFGVSLISGPIVQRSNTKRWGEYRPWVVGLPISTWVGCTLLFLNPPIPLTAKLVVVCVGYMMLHLPMNFLTVAQNGLLMKVAGANAENRLAISSRRIQGTNAGRIISSAATLPLITFVMTRGFNGYFWVSVGFGIFTMIGNFQIFGATKEYDQYNPNKAAVKATPLAKMYGDAFKIKEVWVLLIVDTLKMIAAQIVAGCLTYYYRYSAGNILYQALAGTISSFVALGASMVAVPIARKLGKKASSMVTSFIYGLSYVFIALFADGRPIVYITFACINLVGNAILASYGINLWLDVAEIRLQKTGVDNRPFIMSVQNLPIKIGMIASGPALAWLLNTVGYSAGNMPNTAVFVRYLGFFPAAIYFLTVIIVQFFYNVSEQEAREAAAANQAAAKARAEAAAAAPKPAN